jgi:hypothetical protein
MLQISLYPRVGTLSHTVEQFSGYLVSIVLFKIRDWTLARACVSVMIRVIQFASGSLECEHGSPL